MTTNGKILKALTNLVETLATTRQLSSVSKLSDVIFDDSQFRIVQKVIKKRLAKVKRLQRAKKVLGLPEE